MNQQSKMADAGEGDKKEEGIMSARENKEEFKEQKLVPQKSVNTDDQTELALKKKKT